MRFSKTPPCLFITNMITFALNHCSHSASASSWLVRPVPSSLGNHGLHTRFSSCPPCWARFCQPRPSGLSPTPLPAIQLSSSQGLLQIHLPQRSQRSPPTWQAPCGEMWPCGYLKSASCSLRMEFGQPPPLSSPALETAWKRPPLRSHTWFSSQIFRQGLYIFRNSGLKKEMNVKMPLSISHYRDCQLTPLSFKICFSPPWPPLPCDQLRGCNGLSLTLDINMTVLFRRDLCSWYMSFHLSVCVSASFSMTKTQNCAPNMISP